jgi:hypothetical protein
LSAPAKAIVAVATTA